MVDLKSNIKNKILNIKKEKFQPKADPPRAEKINKAEELQQQVDELTNKWKRALADYQNLEKRVAQERYEFVQYSNALLINKLLEVMDDLEKAEQHIKDQGLSLAIHKLRKVLRDEGVEEISIGKKFDPTLMECVEMVEGKSGIEMTQKGYFLNKKILRPAKVKVGKGNEKKENC